LASSRLSYESEAKAVTTPIEPRQTGTGKPLLRDLMLIARFELGEALRTRMLLVMLLLFIGGGALGAWGFSKVVGEFEKRTASMLKTEAGAKPGQSLELLRETPIFRSFVRAAVDDDEQADYIMRLPPIVLFYGWASFTFLPWLILFTSSDTISTEVASRTIRYTALRTSRLAYALGKATGQAIIILGVTVLCALTFFFVAWANFARFDVAATALGLVLFVPRVFALSLPFLGLAMFASMATANGNTSRLVAYGSAILLSIVAGLSGWLRDGGSTGAIAADLAGYFTPFGRSQNFIFPFGSDFWVSLIITIGLAILYFTAGYALLRRRDL